MGLRTKIEKSAKRNPFLGSVLSSVISSLIVAYLIFVIGSLVLMGSQDVEDRPISVDNVGSLLLLELWLAYVAGTTCWAVLSLVFRSGRPSFLTVRSGERGSSRLAIFVAMLAYQVGGVFGGLIYLDLTNAAASTTLGIVFLAIVGSSAGVFTKSPNGRIWRISLACFVMHGVVVIAMWGVILGVLLHEIAN